MARWLRFLLALALGAVFGLVYGWILKPVEIVDISPSMLSIDYRSDIVLMVAEVYHSNPDLDSTIYVLTSLFTQTPSSVLNDTFSFASEHGYAQTDLSTLQALTEAVNARLPGVSP